MVSLQTWCAPIATRKATAVPSVSRLALALKLLLGSQQNEGEGNSRSCAPPATEEKCVCVAKMQGVSARPAKNRCRVNDWELHEYYLLSLARPFEGQKGSGHREYNFSFCWNVIYTFVYFRLERIG